MMDADTLAKIAQWRVAAQTGTFTLEQQREAIQVLRGVRKTAASTESKPKAGKKTVDIDALFGDLLS